MTLPDDLDDEFVIELETMEEEKAMPYVSSVERVYMNRGLEEGRKEGRKEGELRMARQSLLDATDVRFGDIPEEVRRSIESVGSISTYRALLREAILAESLESFAARLAVVTTKDASE